MEQQRRFVEFVEYNIFNRGQFLDVTQYKQIRRDYEAYTSLFLLKEDVIDYVKNNISAKTKLPSIEGYIGECSASFLWIDIDIEGNLPLATQKLVEIVDRIKSEYKIGYKSLLIFFSGNKGYHLGIPTKSFGAADYSSDILPAAFKLMVKVVTNNSIGVDYKIYNTSRLFRCPYSRHPKSLLYKIPVDVEALVREGIDRMLECANFCNRHAEHTLTIEYSEELKKLFDGCIQQSVSNVDIYTDQDGYDTPISLKENRSIFRLPVQGERNDLMYKMAYRLFAIKGLKVNEVVDIMNFIFECVNEFSRKQKSPRYSEMEFRISMNSAYQRTRLRVVKDIKAKAFASIAKTMFEKIKNAQYCKTVVREFSEDLKGGWQLGNSYALIGKGGTMKSYYLQEELITAAIDEKKPSLFFNLEMSDVTWYDRVWQALFFKSLSDMVKDGDITEKNILEKEEKLTALIGNYLHVYNGVDIEPEDVAGIIKQKEDEVKQKIVLAGIDSVSGMKLYNDSEAVTALRLSKGIKEAAKDTNTAILTINHANSSCPHEARDVSPYVRGGQKFVDNCDAYFSFSNVLDKERSNLQSDPQDRVYKRGVKYLRFVNKRGSGNTINKILRFSDNGRILVLDENPSEYEGEDINPF